MDETLPRGLSEAFESALEELEERLASAWLVETEWYALEPCLWACGCFSVRLS